MKYVLIIVIAVILIKIDTVADLAEKTWMTMKGEEAGIRPDAFGEPPVIVRSNTIVRMTPRQKYLGIMEQFRINPDVGYRKEAMEIFRENPTLFSDKLDRDLESQVYRWRDLIVQNEQEVPLFLLDLMNILKGENLEMVKKFFSVVLDVNLEMFMNSYIRTKDATCSVVTFVEEAVPAEERIPELNERLGSLEDYIAREDVPADKKTYAQTCVTALKLHLDQQNITPAPVPEATTP